MAADWGIMGCGYMAKEYCKVLQSKGIQPQVFSRDLNSENVESFRTLFPEVSVRLIAQNRNEVNHWLVCTNIESHDEICSSLTGRIFCEKPYSLQSGYVCHKEVNVLMNRRYYYWVDHVKKMIDAGDITKIVAVIPETSVDALITQSIHVIDLLWFLAGRFGDAASIGSASPSFLVETENDMPVVINMNYGSYENFSLRFYENDGVVYEAKPLEAFSVAEGMEVRQPDDDIPFRSYRPVTRTIHYSSSSHKPGLEELIDDIMGNAASKLPSLAEHREIHAWMEGNML